MCVRTIVAVVLPLLAVLGISIPSRADLFQLVNYPGDQSSATVTGFIETDLSGGLVLKSNIIAWSFAVNKPGETAYALSHTDTAADLILTGLMQIVNSDLTLQGTLSLGRYFANVGGLETSIKWNSGGTGGTPRYTSLLGGQVLPSGWDSQNPVGFGANPWTIASIPEPTVASLLVCAGGLVIVTRRIVNRASSFITGGSAENQNTPS